MAEHKAGRPDLRLCSSAGRSWKRLFVPLFGWTARRGATQHPRPGRLRLVRAATARAFV